MRLRLMGLSHHKTPVELRERMAVGAGELPEILNGLRAAEGLREVALLSTCNRVEVVWVEEQPCEHLVEAALSDNSGLSAAELSEHLYLLADTEALRHLFRVASSLDSLVLGENQIAHQLKESYRQATEVGTVGTMLHRVYRKTFSVAKRVRTETKVGAATVSVANAAVDMAGAIFESLAERKVLLLGAGEMGELALKGFAARGTRDLWVSNRTISRAADLAAGLGAGVLPWERRVEFLASADIVVCSTGASEPVLSKADVAGVRRARRGRPLFLIDISVPRNLDPAIHDLRQVYLYDVDDLAQVVEVNQQSRIAEADKAEELVAAEAKDFDRILAQVHVDPLLRRLHRKVGADTKAEVERTLSNLHSVLDKLDPKDRRQIEGSLRKMAGAVGKRILHGPIAGMKSLGAAGEFEELGRLARLFGVETTLFSVPNEGDAVTGCPARRAEGED